MRHCLACGVSGAPGVCLECARRSRLGLCEWVSLRLCACLCVCVWRVSVSVCLRCSLSREYEVFLCLCLRPALGASFACVHLSGGSGDRLCPGV